MSILNNGKNPKGRPRVDSEAVTVRMERSLLDRVDDFRRSQVDIPSRPEAVRRLVGIGIGSEPVMSDLLAFLEGIDDGSDQDVSASISALKMILGQRGG